MYVYEACKLYLELDLVHGHLQVHHLAPGAYNGAQAAPRRQHTEGERGPSLPR